MTERPPQPRPTGSASSRRSTSPPTDGPCTGCYYETLFHLPCPIHHPE